MKVANYNRFSVVGDKIHLKKTNPKHFGEPAVRETSSDVATPFAHALFTAFERMNNLDHKAQNLERKMVVAPEEVDIHEVITTMEEARLALAFTKAVIDRAVRAYNDMINLR